MTKYLDVFLSRTLIAVMILLVLTVSMQVFMRYVMSSPVSFTEELSRYLLIWVGLLSASYAYRRRMHLALDLLVLKLQDSNKVALNVFIHSTILFFSLAVLGYGGFELVYMVVELGQSSPSLGISMGFVYLALPISGVAMSIYAIDFIRMELNGEAEGAVALGPDGTPVPVSTAAAEVTIGTDVTAGQSAGSTNIDGDTGPGTDPNSGTGNTHDAGTKKKSGTRKSPGTKKSTASRKKPDSDSPSTNKPE